MYPYPTLDILLDSVSSSVGLLSLLTTIVDPGSLSIIGIVIMTRLQITSWHGISTWKS